MKVGTLIRATLLVGIPVLAVGGLEAVARWGFLGLLDPGLGERPAKIHSFREFVAGRETGLYAPRTYVGYTLNPKAPGINSEGYRDHEFPLERTPGVPRIACIGASTTEGSMAEGGRSFPLHLRNILKGKRSITAEVFNFGVSGWTSAESLVNYNLSVQDYQPDLVIIHHSINDVRPRLWPNYKTDYTHFRHSWTSDDFSDFDQFMIEHSEAYAALMLGHLKNWSLGARVNVDPPVGPDVWKSPAPETARGFIRNIRTLVRLVRANGGVPLITTMPIATESPFYDNAFGKLIREGVIDHNQRLRQLAHDEGVLLLDMDEIWRSDPDIYAGHFIDHVHVNSHGNLLKARNILHFLAEGQVPSVLRVEDKPD